MAFWKGSQGGSQNDIRKKEEGCVQDPEEEKAAEFSSWKDMKVKSIKDSNKTKAGASTNLRVMVWGNWGIAAQWL